MNLKLHITKNYNIKDYNKPDHIKIAVIDTDISKGTQQTLYACCQKHLIQTQKHQTSFKKSMETKAKKLIKKLLDQALKTADDQNIKKELLKRLKLLNPKPKNMVKCNMCGEEVKSKTFRYGKQKTCYECKTKRYTNKTT